MSNGTQSYNLAIIRRLLVEAFTAEDLRRFCQDHATFRPILDRFAPAHGLNDMVAEVIDYCEMYYLFDELLAGIKQANPNQYARFEFSLLISAEELAEIPCPYRGLEPFEADHAEFYFGHEEMVEQLVVKLKAHSLVAVVGPSGSGKSSLVRAGLLTALRRGALPGSEGWVVRVFRPSTDPLRAMAGLLVALLEPEATRITQLQETHRLADSLREGTLIAADVAGGLRGTRPEVPHVVLIVDQLEELYTECQDEKLREIFIGALLAVAEEMRRKEKASHSSGPPPGRSDQ